MASFTSKMSIHLAQKTQIALLIAEKVNMPAQYSDFANVFLKKSAKVFPEYTEINKHAIELEDGKQPPYGPIYRLDPLELETLKTYIKTNLANGFTNFQILPLLLRSHFIVSLMEAFDCTLISMI